MSRTDIRTLAVRIGANMLYHSGALTAIQKTYKRRYGSRGPLDRQIAPFLILLYHRVNPDNDPLFPATPVSVFEQQVRYLAENFRVLSLGEIVRRIQSGSPLEPLTVAITFDDGYLDNYTFAHPVLKQYRVPATLFVATGYIGARTAMWNDQLAWSIKNTAQQQINWRGANSEVSLPIRTREEKVLSLSLLLEELKSLPEREKTAALQQILQTLATHPFEPTRLMLNWADLRRMSLHGWEIGSHTVTHPILTRIGLSEVTSELRDSKRIIENELNRPVNLCAYPNGKRSDFNSTIKVITKETGYEAAVTTIHGVNDQDSDVFELRRLSIWETNLPTLACKLTQFYQRAII